MATDHKSMLFGDKGPGGGSLARQREVFQITTFLFFSSQPQKKICGLPFPVPAKIA